MGRICQQTFNKRTIKSTSVRMGKKRLEAWAVRNDGDHRN